jgi:2-oxoglutarate dehydrogenase E2 component (dihydrolipoamide succinyltransferase)
MIEVKMPQLGESVAEGTVTQWHVKVGDVVRREQPLLEVATDKADSEVPSPAEGAIASIVAKEGSIVPTGGVLCTIDETAKAGASKSGPAQTQPPQKGPAQSLPTAPVGAEASAAESGRALSTPSTRKLAREEGVDISGVRGTGDRGRVTRDDVMRAAGDGRGYHRVEPTSHHTPLPPSLPGAPPSTVGAYDDSFAQTGRTKAVELSEMLEAPKPGVGFRSYKVPAYEPSPGDEVVPFNRRRRITADHMVYSQHVAPHVVTIAEIDMQKVSRIRDTNKGAFEKDGVPLTFLTFVVAAAIKALREFPVLNARVLDDSYVKLKSIHIGVAVDTPGGLLVANVKNADQLSIRGLAKSIDDLAKRARAGKITADDLRGTSFTISNPGKKGNLIGGAIISQPNVGILRIGEIKKRPVVVSDDGEDRIAIHPIMYAALSYDHRIVDGVEANSFLWRIADVLNRGELEIG